MGDEIKKWLDDFPKSMDGFAQLGKAMGLTYLILSELYTRLQALEDECQERWNG